MAATPLQAVQEHVDALNTHQKVRVSETITYPFFQGMPDGKKYWYQDEDAYPASTLGPPLLVDTCSEVARSTDGELIVFDVTVDQANDGGRHRGRRQALYCVSNGPSGWTVVWRQFLGYL